MRRVPLDELLDRVLTILDKQDVQRRLVARQQGGRHGLVSELVQRQQDAELAHQAGQLHPADIAFVLERLAGPRRERLWNAIDESRRGSVLIELGDQTRAEVMRELSVDALYACTAGLNVDDLADLLIELPDETAREILDRHDEARRANIETALSFPEGTAGALMDLDHVTVRNDLSVEAVLQQLRRRQVLPDHTHQLHVVDASGALCGVLPLRTLVAAEAQASVADLLQTEFASFSSDEAGEDVAAAFERYDLITAPVVNLHNHPIGRITVDAVMDFRADEAQRLSLQQVGLSEDEDWHAPVWDASRRRWQWLGLNLLTAFVASRVIGAFEATIEQFVALAALMPIVASIGGNTGNQTAALFIRGLALKQVDRRNAAQLTLRELRIGAINGVVWGFVAALFAGMVYADLHLAGVIIAAMLLTMLVSAFAGVMVPLALDHYDRDPVMGASVILTGITDALGFLIFLGLASILLV